MGNRYMTWLALVLLLSVAVPVAAQQKAEPAEFSTAVVESLMRQFRNGLIAGNADTVLSAFDSEQLPGYDGFAGQLRSFLNTWGNIRVYYQIVQVEPAATGDGGAAQVQFEMEGDDVQSRLPPMRRGAQLQLSIQRTDKGWKIVSFSPRELFQ